MATTAPISTDAAEELEHDPRSPLTLVDDRPVRGEVSLVIPTKNEARNIGWVLERLPAYVDEVILVDSSTDNTVEVARALCPDIKVVTESRPGKGAALRSGFSAARGDYVVMIDADGSMHPKEIERYVVALEDGCDFVKGSRFLDGAGTDDMERLRMLGNAVLRGLVNGLYGQRFSDLCYGFMAFRRDRIADLDLRSDGFEIETEIVCRAAKAKLRTAEVPSFEADRIHGESNLNTWRDGRRVLTTLIRERFTGASRRVLEPLPMPLDLDLEPAHATAPAAAS